MTKRRIALHVVLTLVLIGLFLVGVGMVTRTLAQAFVAHLDAFAKNL